MVAFDFGAFTIKMTSPQSVQLGKAEFRIPGHWTFEKISGILMFHIPEMEDADGGWRVHSQACVRRYGTLRNVEWILCDVENIARKSRIGLGLRNRTGPDSFPVRDGAGARYCWDVQFTRVDARGYYLLFLAEVPDVGIVELSAFGFTLAMARIEDLLKEIAEGIRNPTLSAPDSESPLAARWREFLAGKMLLRGSSYYQPLNGGTSSHEQYVLSRDGSYRYTNGQSALFQGFSGFTGGTEDRGRWRVSMNGESAFLILDSGRRESRYLPMDRSGSAVILDGVRFILR